ncbi:MAG TPA: outer membrane protein assembly factor BamA [Phaeodactylibacter sp.]|nr:outer membrane protein assembly factor BamA [Phaeodactylibacter sp.]
MSLKNILPLLICLFLFTNKGLAQITSDSIPNIDYSTQQDYEIGGITVTGANYSDETAIKAIAGLKVGDKIRIGVGGYNIPKAIKALWKLRLFTDVKIYQTKTIGDIIMLEIAVQERPRLSRYTYKNVKKKYHDDMNAIVNRYLLKGGIITENTKTNAINGIKKFFEGKGYLDATVKVTEVKDDAKTNSVRLIFDVNRNKRVKIKNISFVGNNTVKSRKLRKLMKDTKEKRRIFSSSKFIKEDFETDKKNIIDYYNTIGFRDARILGDSIWRRDDGKLEVQVNIEEGNRYYFRNIAWKGNSIYKTKTLAEVLGIEKGAIYNQELLETRLSFSQDGRDITTLYMDNGYLFFRVDPIEVSIDNDSIDLEIRIYEGPQAIIDKVTIAGNDRTNEHVIRRELRTRPGEKFSRSDIIRSQREIINLGYFNPESMGINTPVNPQRGTVDIEYTVEEKPSDQLELSAGWGGRGRGVIGTLGVSFNNFSVRNILKKESWRPLPQGDGQRLSLRAQTNGRFYQSYNASFTEPWLGGKKPTSFTVAGYYTRLTNGLAKSSPSFSSLGITNFSIGLGTRLKVPDDNFVLSGAINLQNLGLNKWARGDFRLQNGEALENGNFRNFSLKGTLTRTTVVDPIFPRSGSSISLTMQLTPPYSLFKKDNFYKLTENERAGLSDSEISSIENAARFKWLEYHKWKLNADWYTPLFGKFVLKSSIKIGMLGFYDKNIGLSPFERFVLGGDGLAGQQFGLLGNDIISMRGYDVNEIPASTNGGASVYDKMTIELRYPISLNPSATIYVLGFVQGGNAWNRFRDFNPFDMKRSAGLGLRVFLPMFGTLGFDYGLGFDKNLPSGTSWKEYGKFNIILGFEPD